jgi:hypothetical protein
MTQRAEVSTPAINFERGNSSPWEETERGVANQSPDTRDGSSTRRLHRTMASTGMRRTSLPLSSEITCTASCSHRKTCRSLMSISQIVRRLRLIVCTREPVRTSYKNACSEFAHISVGYTSRYTSANSGSLSSAQGRKWPRGAWNLYTSAVWADTAICLSSGGESAATSSSAAKSLDRRQTSMFLSVLSKTRYPLSYSQGASERSESCERLLEHPAESQGAG